MKKGLPSDEQTLLLKACLLSGLEAQNAWENWIRRVDLNHVEGASYNLLPFISRNSSLHNVQHEAFEKCKGVYRMTWVANQMQWEKVFNVLLQLVNAGAEKIVLLKGMAMIQSHYRDFGLRVIGDIEILVAKSDLPLIGPFLNSTGWKQTVPRHSLQNPDQLQRFHSLNYTHPGGMNIDLHWSFIEENSPALDDAVWKGCRPIHIKNICLYVPNPTDLLLQSCVHGMKYSPAPLIRWVVDAMTLLKQEIDWDRLVHLSREAKVTLSLSAALQYLRETFDAPVPLSAMEKIKAIPITHMERLEFRFNQSRCRAIAAWIRYSINRNGHLLKYLQVTARLKSPWQIPLFAPYWAMKRLLRFINN